MITPNLTPEQKAELEVLRNAHPSVLKQIEKIFNKEARYYEKYNIYGMYTFYNKDIYELARIYEYAYLKSVDEIVTA